MRSFNSVRSYYFRAAVAEIARDYGHRHLDRFTLEDFRPLFQDATRQAKAWGLAQRPWRPA